MARSRSRSKLETTVMTIRIESGRAWGLACMLFAVSFASSLCVSSESALAAPRASELGAEVAFTEPSNGYVGHLKVSPAHAPVGTPLTVTGENFPPEQELELVWRTVKGSWKVTIAEYFGREFTPTAYRIATVKSDAAGRIAPPSWGRGAFVFCPPGWGSRGAARC